MCACVCVCVCARECRGEQGLFFKIGVVVVESVARVLKALTRLDQFLTINQCVVPEQWKISKIMPIFKKGCKNAIENYRPIANLCSASKIFEKLILKQIHYLESTNKLINTPDCSPGAFIRQYILCHVLSKLIIMQLNLKCTLLVIAS